MIVAQRSYRDWLIDNVNDIDDYTYLLRKLYSIEFYSLVNYDEDRATDAFALREEWADAYGYEGGLDFELANVLEVLIGIAKRIEFQLFGTRYYDEWDYVRIFWELIDNLGLRDVDVTLSRYTFDECDEKVSQWLNRDKKRHKKCNIFVFENEPKNLEKLNIWTQMGLYIRERWPM